jgi:glyoxylase-like metal-dependent hydrolase (beta-lactamase superfamily II)
MKGKVGNLTIRPIPLIYGPMLQAKMLNQWFWQDYITDAFYVWYIEGASKRILVDSGIALGKNDDMYQPKEKFQDFEDGLKKLGLGFKDIDILIETHLDRDHCEFIHEFTNAKIYVQKAELKVALNPHPMYKTRYYPKEYYEKVKWEVIEGDKKIVDGVEVLLTPGHSPGGQSVAVDTKVGRAIITGFCCLEQNIFPPPQVAKLQEVIPTTIVYDAIQCYDSMVRVKQLGDVVIASHASKYMFVDKIPG